MLLLGLLNYASVNLNCILLMRSFKISEANLRTVETRLSQSPFARLLPDLQAAPGRRPPVRL